MRSVAVRCGPRSRRYVAVTLGVVMAGLAGLVGYGSLSVSRAEPSPPTPSAQPVIGAPPISELIGSSPQETQGETWGFGTNGKGEFEIVRYTPANGWQVQAAPLDAEGKPSTTFQPPGGPLAGATTPAGGVAIVGEDSGNVAQVLVREPGQGFKEAPTLAAEGAGGGGAETEPTVTLKHGETLFQGKSVLLAPVDDPEAHTGVFLVPFEVGSEAQESVLFYRGGKWTREPICVGVESSGEATCVKPAPGFKVVGIDASSPENAWLLATGSPSSEGLMLFEREAGGKPRWVQRPLGPAGSTGARFGQAKLSFERASTHETVTALLTPLTNGQSLTVTNRGIWLDGRLTYSNGQSSSSFTLYYDTAKGAVSASWCSVPAEIGSLCSEPLESSELTLPSGAYRSFAWSEGGPYGERVITGLPNGVTLSLQGDTFKRVLGDGGEDGGEGGAAFSSPQEGWLAPAGEGNPLTHLTSSLEPDRLQSWPVPFRRPLTAIATQPGAVPGDPHAQALAVGQHGQVARYVPARGWVPEALLNSTGAAQTPDLRGVAWPEPGRAYAVGTHGAMWVWQSATGLWEPDPARPPNLFLANFTGIAFDPSKPSLGYAVGQQGVLLSFGKTWEQISPQETRELEAEVGTEERDLNFTSIAFAGGEALVTYQVPNFKARSYTGGVLANAGNGWHLDSQAAATLSQSGATQQGAEVPVRVAGTADGGAVLAAAPEFGIGSLVLERQGPGRPWQPSAAGALAGEPVAAAAFREGGTLRVLISVQAANESAFSRDFASDEALEQPPSEGQAPVATAPYPLPGSGYLLRETAGGWRDEQHAEYPHPDFVPSLQGEKGVDWPLLPDAVLALAIDPAVGEGWAVGGQTGEINVNIGQPSIEAIQTAGVMRYPAGAAAPPGFAAAPEQTAATSTTFAIGGNAQCESPCADLAADQLGPDVSLANAVERAAQTQRGGRPGGVQAFIYTGDRLPPGLEGSKASGAAFQREENRFAQLLQSAGGPLETFASPSEIDTGASGDLGAWEAALGASAPAGSVPKEVEPKPPPPGSGAYAVLRGGVWAIVLDYSRSSLGEEQQCWLAHELMEAGNARTPAIVVGNRGMIGGENPAADAGRVIPILTGSPPSSCGVGKPAAASAYFYDSPEQNRTFTIAFGGKQVPTFGSGTLGYVPNPVQGQFEFFGASGFLLAEVEVATRNAVTNQANVKAKLMPDIAELALEATSGVLLRRSHPSLFTALARRPHAGMRCALELSACGFSPNPYVPIPSTCQGSGCGTGVLPEYTFTSSNPDIGGFVEADPASPEGTTVLQSAGGKPVSDERTGEVNGKPVNERGEIIPRVESGLFCPYNEGTTVITVRTGGLSASQVVTVQGGSVEQPCATVPLRNPPAASREAALPVPPPAPAPAAAPHEAVLPPTPPAPSHAPHPATRPHIAILPSVPQVPAQLYPILPLVPPAAPTAPRPTPPSGTAQVPAQSPISQQVAVTEREEETESATESVHHMAAYEHQAGEGPLPAWTFGLILLAAAAGVGIRRSRPALAHATTSLNDVSHIV